MTASSIYRDPSKLNAWYMVLEDGQTVLVPDHVVQQAIASQKKDYEDYFPSGRKFAHLGMNG